MGQIQGTINQAVIGSSIAVGYAKHGAEAAKANKEAAAQREEAAKQREQRFRMEGKSKAYQFEEKLQNITDTVDFYEEGLPELQQDIRNQEDTIGEMYKVRQDIDTNIHQGLPIDKKQIAREGWTVDDKGVIKNKEGEIMGGRGLMNKQGMRERFGVTDYNLSAAEKEKQSMISDLKAEQKVYEKQLRFREFVMGQAKDAEQYYGVKINIPKTKSELEQGGNK